MATVTKGFDPRLANRPFLVFHFQALNVAILETTELKWVKSTSGTCVRRQNGSSPKNHFGDGSLRVLARTVIQKVNPLLFLITQPKGTNFYRARLC